MLTRRLPSGLSCTSGLRNELGSQVQHMRKNGHWQRVWTPTTEGKAVFFRAEEHTSHRVSLVLLRQSFPSGSILSRKRDPTILCSLSDVSSICDASRVTAISDGRFFTEHQEKALLPGASCAKAVFYWQQATRLKLALPCIP